MELGGQDRVVCALLVNLLHVFGAYAVGLVVKVTIAEDIDGSDWLLALSLVCQDSKIALI